MSSVKAAFEGRLIILPTEAIVSLREPSRAMRETTKYRRIAQSIAEVGVIEPLVVARPAAGETRYLLLDGNTRFAILLERGEADVRCLVSSDDEAFTLQQADQPPGHDPRALHDRSGAQARGVGREARPSPQCRLSSRSSAEG